MIDIRKLKELVRLMVANELTELDLRDSEEQVTLRRQWPEQAIASPGGNGGAAARESGAAPAATAVADPPAGPSALTDQTDGMIMIESPMVGTFYAAPNPDAQAFVKAGSAVGPETPICIIEAMKIFNEIKAECSGTIRRVLVRNGESVEFGQPLFAVEPT
ncbi:MAG: acetyl-CoA carboxylase biotin carboxyl carrier protein [Planctomycetota bacterium]|nr:acetyl-CoA carboxylase biotin carboxyl carrier protein [Planctomycetota bacterium]